MGVSHVPQEENSDKKTFCIIIIIIIITILYTSYDLNNLLVELVLFSDFSNKCAEIAHALFTKPNIYVVLEYHKRCFDFHMFWK